ncbi:MAG: penicillin-binding protein, partial [Rikenellaceae bacterium]
YIDVTPLPAQRGRILSSDGAILVQSTPIHKVTIDFNTVRNSDMTDENLRKISTTMSRLYPSVSAGEYINRFKSWKREAEKRKSVGRSATEKNIIPGSVAITSVTLAAIDTLPIFRNSKYSGGIIVRTTIMREGIYGEMARRVLGRMPDTIAGKNAFGIELSFDEYLRGKDGIDVRRRFAKNLWVPVASECVAPVDGADVVTTLDARMQHYAHTALKKAITGSQAIRGTIIVMDVKTGEIKALSNLGLTKSGELREDYNYGIGMLMCVEPGSTLKLMTLMQLLDHTPTELTDTVHTGNGRRLFYGRPVSDTHGYGTVTLQVAFEKSSNIGFAEAMLRYFEGEPDKYVELIKERGITKPFFLGIDGEVAPYREDPGPYANKKTDALILAYGYGIKFTPLRTLMYYNAVANDGKLVAPHLIKRVEKNGEILKEYDTEVLNDNICKPSTVPKLKQALEGVVLYGTGKSIGNPYFRIAGKTGTARIYKEGGYGAGGGMSYLATFCGYFPADNPKYSCIVAIETFQPEGTYRTTYGGSLAGPAFREISQKMYKMGGDWTMSCLPPVKTRDLPEGETAPEPEPINKEVFVARGNYDKIKHVLSKFDIDKDDVKLFGDEPLSSLKDYNVEEGKMPNVVGMGLRDALGILEKEGFVVGVSGKGIVMSQSIQKGDNVQKGTYVRIVLR